MHFFYEASHCQKLVAWSVLKPLINFGLHPPPTLLSLRLAGQIQKLWDFLVKKKRLAYNCTRLNEAWYTFLTYILDSHQLISSEQHKTPAKSQYQDNADLSTDKMPASVFCSHRNLFTALLLKLDKLNQIQECSVIRCNNSQSLLPTTFSPRLF